MKYESVDATLRRLKYERDRADRRYNEALTELDRTVRPPVPVPDPQLGLDDQKIPALNDSWNILPSTPMEMPGLKGRLAAFIWRVIGPYLQRQLTFNATVVEHMNRDTEARRAAFQREQEAIAAIREQLHRLIGFQSQLMFLFQQVTSFVDTRDRDASSGVLVLNAAISSVADAHDKFRESLEAREQRREAQRTLLEAGQEDLRRTVNAHQQAIVGFNGAISGLADSYAKYRESLESRAHRYEDQTTSIAATHNELRGAMVALSGIVSGVAEAHNKYREVFEARGHRYDERTSAIAAEHEELRNMIALNQQAIIALKRAIEQAGTPAGRAGTPAEAAPAGVDDSSLAFSRQLDAYKYVGFEDQFRGSRAEIREQLESYVPWFDNRGGDILDVGCGRGEFLDLLASRGIAARGIDINPEMAEVCRARGLKVVEADAVGYLTGLPNGSLGGIFAAQVVEHLEPAYLLRFLELAFEKLQPGGRLVLETINPACWTAFFESYIRDVTHRWPLHPETLKYLATASGFSRADIHFRTPVPPEDRLQSVAVPEDADEWVREIAEALNANVEKLNARMFTHMDYAIVAEKG